MAKFILAYDDSDTDLGHFFGMCASDLKMSLNKDSHHLLEIQSRLLTSAYIDIKLGLYLDSKFIFTAYSHGNSKSLASSETYLSTSSNLSPFKDSLFYTFSCSSGIHFGNKLIENGCLAFVGYKIDACIVRTFEEIFYDCANHGIKCFIAGSEIGDSFTQMKKKHTEEIDKIYSKNFFVASTVKN